MDKLTKDDLKRAAESREYETVEIFGREAQLRKLTLREAEELALFARPDGNPDPTFAARMIASCLVNGDGELMFDIGNAEDIAILGGLPSSEGQRLATAALRLNAMNEEQREAIEKNLEGGQSAA